MIHSVVTDDLDRSILSCDIPTGMQNAELECNVRIAAGNAAVSRRWHTIYDIAAIGREARLNSLPVDGVIASSASSSVVF